MMSRFQIAKLELQESQLLTNSTLFVDQCLGYLHRVNPGIQVLQVSATSGEGLDDWYQWLRLAHQSRLPGLQPAAKVDARESSS